MNTIVSITILVYNVGIFVLQLMYRMLLSKEGREGRKGREKGSHSHSNVYNYQKVGRGRGEERA